MMVRGRKDGVDYFLLSDHFEDLAWFSDWVEWWVYV